MRSIEIENVDISDEAILTVFGADWDWSVKKDADLVAHFFYYGGLAATGSVHFLDNYCAYALRTLHSYQVAFRTEDHPHHRPGMYTRYVRPTQPNHGGTQ